MSEENDGDKAGNDQPSNEPNKDLPPPEIVLVQDGYTPKNKRGGKVLNESNED